MILQEAPRKNLYGYCIEPEKGFWLEGKNYEDCIRQLEDYGKEHPEKWIYYYDCGLGPSYPIPVARHLFEVSIYDYVPAGIMLFATLFQEGKDGKREIDMMTDEQRAKLTRKHLHFLYSLGNAFRRDE